MAGRSSPGGSGESFLAPRWAAGTYRLVDYRGRRPPEAGTDEWGVTWAPLPPSDAAGSWPGGRAAPHMGDEIAGSYPVAHPAASARELLQRSFPNGRDPAPFAGLLRPAGTSRTGQTEKIPVLIAGRHPLGPLDRLCALLGPERGLLALVDEPDAARTALNRMTDYHIAIAANYLAAGCTAGWLADEYAGLSGPLVRPALWRELVLPGLRRIIDVYRVAGASVCFHMCGRADAFLHDLLGAGVEAFDLEVY